MSEKIFIRTKGEDTVFFAKVTKMRSIDFYRVDHPSIVASIADLDDASCAFLRLNQNHQLVITQEQYENNVWSYGGQRVRVGFIDQTEKKMKSGKTFIFREGDVYTDLDYITGTTIGFAHSGEMETHLLCRCYVSNGVLAIQFAG